MMKTVINDYVDMWVDVVLSADGYSCRTPLSFSIRTDSFSPHPKRQLTILSLWSFFYDPNIFLRWDYIPNQLLLKPSSSVISSTVTNPSPQLSLKPASKSVHGFDLSQYGITPVFSTANLFRENYKNLIFQISPIQNVKKNITTTIFSKANKPCYITIS